MLRIEEMPTEVVVFAPNGHLVIEVFPKRNNLSLALEYLKQINHLKTRDDTPIYDLCLYEGYSLWAFQQQYLYESHLKIWAKYADLLEWLHAHDWPQLALCSKVSVELQNLLQRCGVTPSDENRHDRSTRKIKRGEFLRRILLQLWLWQAEIIKAKVLVYTPDIVSDRRFRCDFRFTKAYAWLNERQIPFVEIFHIGSGRSVKNALKRCRIPLYLELWQQPTSILVTDDICYDQIESHLRPLAKKVISAYINICGISALRVDKLRKIIRRTNIRVLLGMDDFRANNELLLACKLEGVRTILIQHGLITRFHTGWMNYHISANRLSKPDHYLVHAHFWKETLINFESRLQDVTTIVSGWDENITVEKRAGELSQPKKSGEISVLFLYETSWYPDEVRNFAQKMLSDSRIRVLFKIRPDLPVEEQVYSYFGAVLRPHQVLQTLGDVAEEVDVIIGSHSSLLYKLLIWKKSIFRLVTSYEFGEQLSLYGLAEDLHLEDAFFERFQEACQRDPEVYNKRLRDFQGCGKYPDYANMLDKYMEEYL